MNLRNLIKQTKDTTSLEKQYEKDLKKLLQNELNLKIHDGITLRNDKVILIDVNEISLKQLNQIEELTHLKIGSVKPTCGTKNDYYVMITLNGML